MTKTYLFQHNKANPAACGCNISEGFCEKHRAMMREIYEAYYNGPAEAFHLILSMQDGYGEPGFVPVQGPDWSGVRDSSLETVEAMYLAIHS